MATHAIAPRLGEGVTELTVVRWLKQEGEPVTELESLLEVETDKVVTEIPSPASGTLLKRVVEENAVAGVGSIIAWIGQPGEAVPGAGVAMPEPAGARSRETSESAAGSHNGGYVSELIAEVGGQRGFISPVVAKIAGEKHVD